MTTLQSLRQRSGQLPKLLVGEYYEWTEYPESDHEEVHVVQFTGMDGDTKAMVITADNRFLRVDLFEINPEPYEGVLP